MAGSARRFCGLALSASLSLGATSALAQQDATGRTLAVQVFDEAESLLSQDQVGLACPKYAESYRLDPQLGVLVFLAECYEKNGQLASAWATFREAEEVARERRDGRTRYARERVQALQPRLSRLTVQVPEASHLRGLSVFRDGVILAPAIWGVSTPTDAGKHTIEVTAPGRKSWRTEIVVPGEKGAVSVVVPALAEEEARAPNVAKPSPEPLPAAAPPSPPAVTPAEPREPQVQASVAAPFDPSPGSSRHLTAMAVGGLGIVGFGVGGFLGVSAQSSFSDSKTLCNDADICTPTGTELRRSAKTKALVATVATGVGAAALVTAAVLWFTAPSPESSRLGGSKARRTSWSLAPSPNSWGMVGSHDF